jgi:adenosylhomocysteine nucleosidase
VLVVTTFALSGEFAAWRRLRPFRRSANGPGRAYEARIGGVRLRVVLTGIGERAATASAAVVFHDRPDLCIASGFAAGLIDALRVADVIAPGQVRGPDGPAIDSDPSLLALAARCGAKPIETLYSAPSIVLSSEEKRRLSVAADAVDMESATILAESGKRGVPGIAIRAISDPASRDLPIDFSRVLTADAGLSVARVIGAVARRPRAVPGLVRLGVEGHRAATALSRFLDTYLERLS